VTYKINTQAYEIFKSETSSLDFQDPIGFEVSEAMEKFEVQDFQIPYIISNFNPSYKFTRYEVEEIVRVETVSTFEVIFVIFAWGATNHWAGVTKSPKKILSSLSKSLLNSLSKLRNSNIDCAKSFDRFLGNGLNLKIESLGPSYFTKLLFFFDVSNTCFIMDKYTKDSFYKLTGKKIKDTPEDYCMFNEFVSNIAKDLNISGSNAEYRLFSWRD